VTVYDAGTPADTTYTYDTTTGELLRRDFPTNGGNHIRTTYSYDGAGRLEYETITREAMSTTNLYRTQYAYNWLTYGNEVVRTEQTYSGGWVNDNELTYQYNPLSWQTYEQRRDWTGLAWASKYTVSQTYDKNGNRTVYNKSVAVGGATTYGRSPNLSYTYDNLNRLTQVTDGNDANYNAAVTSDANGNITLITETAGSPAASTIYSYFDVDDLNRVTALRVKFFQGSPLTGNWQWVKRAHEYSATGQLLHSTYKTWLDGSTEPAGDSLQHTYSQDGRHIQNTDGAGTYGYHWHWAGAMFSGSSPLKGPNADTASQNGYNAAPLMGGGNPQRRTFLTPTTEGDKRELWGQGRPQAKDSVASWATGKISVAPTMTVVPNIESRFEFTGTVTATDMSRATDVRENGKVGIFGSALGYKGSSGRVENEAIGRSINPMGAGDGRLYAGGNLKFSGVAPSLPGWPPNRRNGNGVNGNDMVPVGIGRPGVGGGTGGNGGGGSESGSNNPSDCPHKRHTIPCCPCKITWDEDLKGHYDCEPGTYGNPCFGMTLKCGCDGTCASDGIECLGGPNTDKALLIPFYSAAEILGCADNSKVFEAIASGDYGKVSNLCCKECNGLGGCAACRNSGGGGGALGGNGTTCPGCMLSSNKFPGNSGGNLGGGSTLALNAKEKQYLECETGCRRLHPNTNSQEYIDCAFECGVIYMGWPREGNQTPPGPIFVDANDPIASFLSCLGGPGSFPSLEAAATCLTRVLAATGCEGMCNGLYRGNANAMQACKKDCCCTLPENPEITMTPGESGSGEVAAVGVDAFQCLCQRLSDVYQLHLDCTNMRPTML
jgi:hypothetical protein